MKEEIKELSDKIEKAELDEREQEIELDKMIDEDLERRTNLHNDRKTTAKTAAS